MGFEQICFSKSGWAMAMGGLGVSPGNANESLEGLEVKQRPGKSQEAQEGQRGQERARRKARMTREPQKLQGCPP